MNGTRTLDVSSFPIGTADSRSLIWWGNLGMMVIEGTMFALLVATYLYLETVNFDWPPASVPNPDLISSTINVIMLTASCLAMLIADRGALRDSVGAIRTGLGICILVGIAFLIIRVIAVSTLGFKWSDHAYGSVIWTMIGMHTFHMIAATCESGLLFVYTFLRPVTKKQLLDVRTTAVYWYFVAMIWVPFYFIIYVVPYLSRK
ncbi:MAG TPA: cytochrome c oxidase subunit 3 [Thermoanaerobaculia bacterium]|jgi:cytochrome c oxidase subunit I+III